jgi:hypothetical protein
MVVSHKIRNSGKNNVVIDDLRFDNEAERLAEDFGKENVLTNPADCPPRTG